MVLQAPTLKRQVVCLIRNIVVYFNVCSDEVAVIDEIQMLRDPSRGWAWTRAFLGKISFNLKVTPNSI